MADPHRITQWRKRLERSGWLNARRFARPNHEWIEYHAVWKGRIYSGRCRLSDLNTAEDYWRPGSHVYLLGRGLDLDVQEAVWRKVGRRVIRPNPQLTDTE